MTTFTYNYSSGIGMLNENARMKNPDATKVLGANPSGSDYEVIDELREMYDQHLSTLRHIQVSDPSQWVDKIGKTVGEGEFEVRFTHIQRVDGNDAELLAHRVPAEQPNEGKGAKSATQILSEHGINIMELNDDFNTQLLHSMERYAEQYNKHLLDGLITTLKVLRTVLKTAGLELGAKKADELIKDYSNI